MEKRIEAKGKCLCGAVRLTSKADKAVTACHCSMCRRWGGGPLLAVLCGTDVDIQGQDAISTYDSSQWAERGFCHHCGTHLFYRVKGSEEYHIPVGLFDEQSDFNFQHQIFIDRKPAFYEFINRTENLTEEETFKKFAPKD